MATFTPADLALELGRSQRRIRAVLRNRYGSLPEGETRWILDEAQADFVRSSVGRSSGPTAEWLLEIGDVVRRRSIHRAYGGQQQGGISTPKSIPDILIFTDPKSGAQYGYDKYEGLREDGSYSYTGEGQYGPQPFVRGNLAVRDSAAEGRTIRLFTTHGPLATYVGAFTTGQPTYHVETIPDLAGNPRTGIIFNLVPIDADERLLPAYGGEAPSAQASVERWYPPDYSDVVIAPNDEILSGDRVVTRLEFELQSEFGEWVASRGFAPHRLTLPIGNSRIEPDLYLPELAWIVEAKRSSGRAFVRTAIGQVLDYAFVAKKSGVAGVPVILLPGRPDAELVELIRDLGIVLVIRSGSEFTVTGSDALQ
jgi:hypothetical protein